MSDTLDVDVVRSLGEFHLEARFCLPLAGLTALFGVSGSGKTTLVNILAGIVTPERGHVRLGATTWYDSARRTNLPTPLRGIGYVFQEARLFPHLTVAANLRYGMRRARGRQTITQWAAVVEMLALGALLGRAPYTLSGGERQRVALGRALLAQPRLLLMDEPLAALDAQRKNEILPYIERLRDETRLPIVYVSHAIEEVTRLANGLVLLAAGRTVAAGELLTIMADPQYAPYIGRYEAGAVLECRIEGHDPVHGISRLSFADGQLEVPIIDLPEGALLRIGVRSGEVALATARVDGLSISNQLPGRVGALVERGDAYVEVVVDLGQTSVRSLVTRRSVERLALRPGLPIWALIKSVALDRRGAAT